MTSDLRARVEAAWLAYRDKYARTHPWCDARRVARQTRKREFVAGFEAALLAEPDAEDERLCPHGMLVGTYCAGCDMYDEPATPSVPAPAADGGEAAEPIETGWYAYSGGRQSIIFHLRDTGQWSVHLDNGSASDCAWGYIEQALGVWDLVLIDLAGLRRTERAAGLREAADAVRRGKGPSVPAHPVADWLDARAASEASGRCVCGSDASSLNPAEVVVHRTDGPCTIEPAASGAGQ